MTRFGRISTAGLLGALVILGGSARQAKADFEVVFDANTSNVANGVFVYSLVFNSGTTSTGAPSESLQSGNYATVYDIAGYTGTTVTGPFTFASNPTGVTPDLTAPPDSAALPNVTLTYTGPTLTADQSFTAAVTITSTVHSTVVGYYTGQTLKATNNTMVGAVGRVNVAGVAVPVPASAVLMGFGSLGTLVAAFRRKRTA